MKRFYAALMALALLSVACGGIHPPPGPQPSPTPTPVPSPSPVPSPIPPPVSSLPEPTLLSVKKVGGQPTNQWINTDGKRVWLEGSGGLCCHVDPKLNQWPQAADKYIREIAAHGGNLIHLRVGPYSKELEPRPEFRPYLDNGDFNPAFFTRLNATLDLAYSLGVYVEIDLIDGWALKDPANNWWHDSVNIMRRAPTLVHQHLVQEVEKRVGQHQNILWQMGNENGVPTENCPAGVTSLSRDSDSEQAPWVAQWRRTLALEQVTRQRHERPAKRVTAEAATAQCPIVTLAWELGIADAIRIAEDKNGHPRHPRGSNAGLLKVDKHGDIDYLETHQCQAPEQPHYTGKPVGVNECNPESFSNFQRQLGIAQANGTYYQLWWSDMPTAQWNQSLDLIAAYRKAHP